MLALLLLGAGSALPLNAQPTEAERKTFEQTKAAAEKGDAEAQLHLGSLYATGNGVARDLVKAAKWHRKAAEQGLARAELRLGWDYASGAGVKVNKEEAVKWFRRAADQKLVEAELYLGMCYSNGDGVRENAVEAAKWYRKAAEQGMPQGEYELGRCYLEGAGVAKDITEGIKWIRQAAQEGWAPAQNKLGECYVKGVGVTKDNVQAYKWFNLAAGQSDDDAPDIRVSMAKVEQSMTPEQVAEAQRLAREFKPGPSASPESVAGTPSAAGTNANPSAETPKTGIINVKADDDNCEVFADGAFVGNSPARLKLSEGNHVIEVKKPGFKDYHREIQVNDGADLNLRVVLESR